MLPRLLFERPDVSYGLLQASSQLDWSPQILYLQLISIPATFRTNLPTIRTSNQPVDSNTDYSDHQLQPSVTSSRSTNANSDAFTSALSSFPASISLNMLTYTEYYQTTTSPLGVGPARDLAYQTIYDYFAEETATPNLWGP
eukprot:jgi/Psemu1/37537/gm1.37537_g